jgi:hypothetical protein
MDLNDFWQENKRFVLLVTGGLLAFLIGMLVVDSLYGSELKRMNTRLTKAQNGLKSSMYQRRDLDAARDENERLRTALSELREAVEFAPRPEFAPGSGPAANRYFAVVSEVRDDLTERAGRAGLALDAELGLPGLSPTREAEILRYLEGLDLVDRVARLALEVGVRRMEKIRITLDSRLVNKKGIDGLEKTLVGMQLYGPSPALVRLVLLTQQPREERVIALEKAEFIAHEDKPEEARLDLVLLAAHVHGLDELLGLEQAATP